MFTDIGNNGCHILSTEKEQLANKYKTNEINKTAESEYIMNK